MGGTAENLARMYDISRDEVDRFAESSFARAVAAQESGYHGGEIAPLQSAVFALEGYADRTLRLPRGVEAFARDEHVKPTPFAVLQKIRPAFGGVQTGGNSSAIVDGAAAAVVATGTFVRAKGLQPLARIVASTAVGVPPEIMGIGPAPAIRGVLELAGLSLADIDRFDINEAFAAQVIAVERELGLARDRLNVNGGSIAIGHPLAVSGLRCTLTVARELARSGLRFGIASACCGGGQGVAVLVENPAFVEA
jgi:acetyl-CoA C-acetyltransferase